MTPIAALSRLLVALALMLGLAGPAFAVLKVDITGGYSQPMPIAVPTLSTGTDVRTPFGTTTQMGQQIAAVVRANLSRSGLFRSIEPSAYLERVTAAMVAPTYRSWSGIGAQALVTGKVDIAPDGALIVEFRLWDVVGQSQISGMRYTLSPKDWRRAAHKISDQVYERLTGETGYFDSRIVYIAESGSKKSRIKRLAIMDQDGANHKFLTNGQTLVLTPRFSPSQQEITYMAYYNNRPRVYLYNIESGRHELLGNFDGMTFAPRFSPDGNKVVMSLARGGNSDIYLMDLRTKAIQRLTNHPGIDTSPSFSPDGNRIVFNSDRGGSQQLYVMSVDGSGVQRISFGQGRYGTPVWSPRGDLIAFTKIGGGTFRIGVMRPDGKGERLLTNAWQDEGPTWSPNGRVIMFFRTDKYGPGGSGGRVALRSIDLTGLNERRIDTPVDASDPAWSPLLQ